MKAITVQSEACCIDYTPGSDIAAGDVVDQNGIIGIAVRPIASGKLGALCTEGLYTVAKDNSDVAVGDKLYWDADGNPYGGTAGTGAFTKTSSGNTYAGRAYSVAGTTTGTCKLLLGVV